MRAFLYLSTLRQMLPSAGVIILRQLHERDEDLLRIAVNKTYDAQDLSWMAHSSLMRLLQMLLPLLKALG